MKTVFMGTPEFAVPSLRALLAEGYAVDAVFTQPDRPAGRGKKLSPSPVKSAAVELALPVEQPVKVRAPEAFERLGQLSPDVIVVVGYGQIIPQRVIDLPRYGCVNVHSSLLPKYRGAAPINWAIANGEKETGVTTMQIVKKLDAGDMLLKARVDIGPEETAAQLNARLAPVGADLLIETLRGLAAGTIEPEAQDDAESTYAPIMTREDGLIDWAQTANRIYNRLRGFEPWPGAYTRFRGKRLHVRWAKPDAASGLAEGAIQSDGETFLVGCGADTTLRVHEVQVEGKKRGPAGDFLRGYRPERGELLGQFGE